MFGCRSCGVDPLRRTPSVRCWSGYLADDLFVSGFEGRRAQLPEAGVPSTGVVPAFDVVENGSPERNMCRPGLVLGEFVLDRGEERFADRVVPALPAPAHGQTHVEGSGGQGELLRRVLRPTI